MNTRIGNRIGSLLLGAVCCLGLVAVPTQNANADLSMAREMAYRIAAKLRDRGFTLFPGENGDNSKEVQTFEFPVTKGLDYAFLVASDSGLVLNVDEFIAENELDIDLYLEDEFGTQIVADTRDNPDAFVQFTSQYNGTAKAKLVFAFQRGGQRDQNIVANKGKVYRRFFFIMGVRGTDPTPP